MKIENSIGWCDETINAVTGCDKVSPGCKNCYAQIGTRARVLRGQGIETWGPYGVRHPVNFEPVFRRLNRLCVCDKCHESRPIGALGAICEHTQDGSDVCKGTMRRIRLFADSNSDWLDPKWPIETLARLMDAMRLAPNIDVLLLTKRIENFRPLLQTAWRMIIHKQPDLAQWIYNWEETGTAPDHVWLGVSVENQKCANQRIPELLKIPAAVRLLSAEPLLENIDIARAVRLAGFDKVSNGNRASHEPGIDWVIVGGESGKERPDCGVSAIVSVHDQCVAAGVPVYVKQDVAFKSGQQGRIPDRVWQRKEFPVPQMEVA